MRFTTIVFVLSTIIATAHVSAVTTGPPSSSGGGQDQRTGGGGSGGNDNGFSKRHLVVPDSNLHTFLRRPTGIVDQRLKAIWNSYRQEEERSTATTTTQSMQRQAVHDAVAEFRAQLVQRVQDFVDARAVTARDVSQDIQDLVNQYVDTALESFLLSNLEDSEIEEQAIHHRPAASESGLRARVAIWLDGLGRTLFAQVWEDLTQRNMVRLRSHVDHDRGDHNGGRSKTKYDHVEDRVLSVYKD
ncbi:hypothetical protein BG006_002188 [Podila minutissima]|uniref:Uncharacterized protein n=1 Tax=Podila minutissima TaxID=64525 RepID=A0A9P5VGM1_9FUNG|nr:hypothetical protein BG006_002188 [Podila minutissima]